jgi:hypothetical protein
MSAQRDRDEDWRDFAACRGRIDLQEAFFPDDGRRKFDDRVATLCHGCPVTIECGKFGFSIAEQSGIWGGRLKIPASKRVLAERAENRVAAPKPSLPD